MSNSSIAGQIVRHSTSPGALRAALHRPALKLDLASNPRLDNEVWFAAWPSKPRIPVDAAIALVSRTLSPEQVEHAVADGRVSVIKPLLRYNSLHTGAVEALLRHKNASQLADVVLEAEEGHPYDEDLRRSLVTVAKGFWLLQELRFMDADAIRSYLASWSDWAPRWSVRRNSELARLAEARPDILEDLASSPFIDIVSAAAGCRHLRDGDMQMTVVGGPQGRSLEGEDKKSYLFAMLKLANLPAATQQTLETLQRVGKMSGLSDVGQAAGRRLAKSDRKTLECAYADVSDPDQLKWLFQRAMPAYNSSFGPAKDKPLEIEALAYNPFLTEEQAQVIGAHLCGPEASIMMVDPAAALAALGEHFSTTSCEVEPLERYAPAEVERSPRDLDVPASPLSTAIRFDPVNVAAWLEQQGLSGAEWDSLLSIADANPEITTSDLVVLAKALAVS